MSDPGLTKFKFKVLLSSRHVLEHLRRAKLGSKSWGQTSPSGTGAELRETAMGAVNQRGVGREKAQE